MNAHMNPHLSGDLNNVDNSMLKKNHFFSVKIKYDDMQGNYSVMLHLLPHNLLLYASLQS